MRQTHSRRRGIILVAALILLAGMSVVVIALAYEVSMDLKMNAHLTDGEQALECARAGIDNLIYIADHDSNWRTNCPNGAWITDKPLGDGSFNASGTDDDGDLTDCPIDLVSARSVGTYNGATRTVTATLTPPPHEAMMYLAQAANGAKDIEIRNAPRIYGDLCAADHVEIKEGSAPDFRGDVYVLDPGKVSAALDDDDTDILTLSSDPVQPTVDYTWFIARGAQISPPVVDGKYVIADKVISPDTNPHGFSNANGVYYVQGDKELRIVRCHITATLVFAINRKIYFEKAVVHAPAVPYYPALVTDKEVYYSLDQNLSETESGIDFNADGDTSDVFTPTVRGVVYAKSRIEGLQCDGGTNVVRFKGALISDKIVLIGSGCIFEQDPALSTNLVNQFQGSGLRLVPGSLRFE
jgi:hypothetical protein